MEPPCPGLGHTVSGNATHVPPFFPRLHRASRCSARPLAPGGRQMVEGVKSAARGLRHFDEEHELVHKATEGAREAWRGLREVSRAGMMQ